MIINYQVEQLVAKRTSEYAHSIAKIAANSSAQALLSKDKEQLDILVVNVAKDPYIRSATIYSDSGQIVAQFPDISSPRLSNHPPSMELPNSSTITDKEKMHVNARQDRDVLNKSMKAQTWAYLQSQKDIPFVEKITFQDVTTGWFKVTLNRQRLESSFRQSLSRSQNVILLIAGVLLSILFIVITRFQSRVKLLVSFVHRLIQINALRLPNGEKQWMDTIQELSETQFQNLPEHKRLPEVESVWLSSKRPNNTIFCYCQFAMEEQEDEQTAACLTQAEHYLQAAIQTHGVQSQGNVLSGCLIPFFDYSDKKEALTEALALIQLVKELLDSLDLPIKMRAFLGTGSILVLENDRAEITGVSLSNRLASKIYKLTPFIRFGNIVSLCFEMDELSELGKFEPIDLKTGDNQLNIPSFRLLSASFTIEQQVSRQVNYIKANNSI